MNNDNSGTSGMKHSDVFFHVILFQCIFMQSTFLESWWFKTGQKKKSGGGTQQGRVSHLKGMGIPSYN